MGSRIADESNQPWLQDNANDEAMDSDNGEAIHNDLVISESDEDQEEQQDVQEEPESRNDDEDEEDGLWF